MVSVRGSDLPVVNGIFPLKQRHFGDCDRMKIPAQEYSQPMVDMEQALDKLCYPS